MPCLLLLPAALGSIFFLTGGVTAFVRKSSEKSLIPASIIAGAYGASAYLMTIKPYEFSGYVTAIVTSVLAVAVGLYMLSVSAEAQASRRRVASGVYSFALVCLSYYAGIVLKMVYTLPVTITYNKSLL